MKRKKVHKDKGSNFSAESAIVLRSQWVGFSSDELQIFLFSMFLWSILVHILPCFQGKAGVVPSTEELTVALENHDLFLYFGHGSGVFPYSFTS